MDLYIEKLTDSDLNDLYTFELENRSYFEEMVPSRGDDYYKPDIFKVRNEALLQEQAGGISNFYLIKDDQGTVLGRINLVDIDETHKIGHLGYRIGRRYSGRGIAKKALSVLLETVKDIKQVHAKTTTANMASQKILEGNGFVEIATDEEDFEMRDQKFKFVYYSWSSTNHG
ncbi:GNAT family N-acetyltransferase [Sporosarcina jeotgali]|uniref:GNAT family N-acetyltransferase n=1 Tax=Sporosarcina jeotgali TaxID=3020056 RepID=A0ABZ0KSQ7_9BACL|nr:GNAT family N-acetyltransferase [Sporosarcina sp. B2O-1]WOV82979.1 GNAT family N-acetyltransferase [Sporosarcina sp. B2O-1]